MGLNVNQKANLHNKFKLVLSDSKTGKIKQEAYAYNIILNNGLSAPVYHLSYSSAYSQMFMRSSYKTNRAIGGFIHIGAGTGTLDPTRNTLFNEIARIETSFYDRDKNIEELTASYTQVAVFDETMAQNTSITEVGLGNGISLTTHALIEDSEGNPIVIEKGELDILTVYSTVYITLSHPYNDNFRFIEGSYGNMLLDMVYRNSSVYYGSKIQVGRNNDITDVLDNGVKTLIFEKEYVTEDRDFVSPKHGPDIWGVDHDIRISAKDGNMNEGIWEIAFLLQQYSAEFSPIGRQWCPVFRAVMPIPGVWDGYNITGEIVGVGDGITKIFNLRWFPIVDLSETIYINDTPLIRNTDYTINTETSEIIFTEAPPQNVSITADYSIKHIPKDEDHVLDINFSIVFADGGSV